MAFSLITFATTLIPKKPGDSQDLLSIPNVRTEAGRKKAFSFLAFLHGVICRGTRDSLPAFPVHVPVLKAYLVTLILFGIVNAIVSPTAAIWARAPFGNEIPLGK